MKDYTFISRPCSLKTGQGSKHVFLGHLFNLAVYGLNAVSVLSIVFFFVCFLNFFFYP